MKHNSNRRNISIRSTLLFGFFCVLLTPLSSAHAYFSSVESSGGNLFGASSIDVALVASGEEPDARTLSVSNSGNSSFNTEGYTNEVSDPLLSFCDEVNVTLDSVETDLLSLVTPSELLEVGGAKEYALEFSVDDPEANLEGKTCAVEFVFEASQVGFSYGEAFYDTEIYTLTLYGEDFSIDEHEDDELTAEDCKDGGWESEIFAEFNFENQGHCVSHFASDGTSTDARNKSKQTDETTSHVETLGRSLLTQTPLIEETHAEPTEEEGGVTTEESEEVKLTDDEDGDIDSEGRDEEGGDEGEASRNEEGVLEEEEE